MDLRKTLSASALALSVSFGGLAIGASAALADGHAGAVPVGEKGADKKCGKNSCGKNSCGKKDGDKEKDKKEKGSDKGADHKCGKGSCG